MSQGHQGWESTTLCFWEVQSESVIIWVSLKGTGSWSHYPGSYVSLGIIFTWLREVLKCLHREKWNIKNSNHPILCPQWLCIFNDFFTRGYKIELQSPLKKTAAVGSSNICPKPSSPTIPIFISWSFSLSSQALQLPTDCPDISLINLVPWIRVAIFSKHKYK